MPTQSTHLGAIRSSGVCRLCGNGADTPDQAFLKCSELLGERILWYGELCGAGRTTPIAEVTIADVLGPPVSLPVWKANLKFAEAVEAARRRGGAISTHFQETKVRQVDLNYL